MTTEERLQHAREYVASGLSLVPIGAGEKRPVGHWVAYQLEKPKQGEPYPTWKTYQERQPTDEELTRWVSAYPGLGVVGGKVSTKDGAALEILDVEAIAMALMETFRSMVERRAPGLIGRLPRTKTPSGGRHIFYRCETIEGNQKLAERAEEVAPADLPRTDDGALDLEAIKKDGLREIDGKYFKIRTLIETRGEGGQVLSPLCTSAAHPSGGVYELINGDLRAIPTITAEERDALLTAARACNEWVDPAKAQGNREARAGKGEKLKPGQDYNARSDAFEKSKALIEDEGWSKFGDGAAGELVSRPGVDDHASGTLFSWGGLHVFSSNASPFEANKTYTPFAIYAELKHRGDYSAAALELSKQGYGDQSKKKGEKANKNAGGETADDTGADCDHDYRANGTGLIYLKRVFEQSSKEWRDIPVQLTNFTATIKSDVSRDDGAEQIRVFEVEASLANNGGPHRGRVTATEFSSLRWADEILGARATVFPGKREYAAVAIRLLSENIDTRRVIAHTGWRFDDGTPLYHHAGGAIGADGLVEAEVELPAELAHCNLPAPPTGARLKEVIRAIAYKLARVAPDTITLPSIGSGFAAVIPRPDFAPFLVGETGSGKSELAALIQSFFGAGFNAKTLPDSWISSANSLEIKAHTAKDCVFTVDDFNPAGSTHEQMRMHAAADRLLRANANAAGRGRARTDGGLRVTKAPRGLILCTGEDLPRGHSLRARLAIIQVEKDSVNWARLTDCQKAAREGVYASAMSAFIQWLAKDNRIATLQKESAEKIGKLRDAWVAGGVDAHKKSATTLAYIERAWGHWLEFAGDAQALDDDEITALREAVRSSLDALGRAQERYLSAESPALKFFELLQSAIVSGKAHLANMDNDRPDNCEAWGWRAEGEENEFRPLGDRIGWVDGDDVYLHPETAYKSAQAQGVNGEGLSVTTRTLWKRLDTAGDLKTTSDRNTIKKTVGHKRLNVIHVSAGKFGIDSAKAGQAESPKTPPTCDEEDDPCPF